MRLCGSDLAAGGLCFTPVSLSTGECPKADAHVIDVPTLIILPEPTDETTSEPLELVTA